MTDDLWSDRKTTYLEQNWSDDHNAWHPSVSDPPALREFRNAADAIQSMQESDADRPGVPRRVIQLTRIITPTVLKIDATISIIGEEPKSWMYHDPKVWEQP